MDNKYKFKASSKYFTICLYVILTTLIIFLMAKAIFFWSSTSAVINSLISTLAPFFIGILIAFLLNPLVNWLKHSVFGKLCHIKSETLNNTLSIVVAYIGVLLVLITIMLYAIPALVDNLQVLIKKVPAWKDSILGFVESFDKKFPSIDMTFLEKSLRNADKTIIDYLKQYKESISETLVMTGMSIITVIVNFIIAIIVSCYLIVDKKLQKRSVKRIIYAMFDTKRADIICKYIKMALKTFTDFFSGKMIDSLALGLLNLLGMLIFGLIGFDGFLEAAALVSLLVGVTNMIPYFGAYIGSIPSIVLLFIYSPQSGLIYAIFIIVLMQIDGNIIGPKILGESTGLRPLWIIFAITIGGWFYGIPGMLLGVPVVATISTLVEDIVDKRLRKKEITMPTLKTYADIEREKQRLSELQQEEEARAAKKNNASK